jgi:hypothetical protein
MSTSYIPKHITINIDQLDLFDFTQEHTAEFVFFLTSSSNSFCAHLQSPFHSSFPITHSDAARICKIARMSPRMHLHMQTCFMFAHFVHE